MIDSEILTSPGFLILYAIAAGATLLGFVGGKNMGMPVMPIWQLIVILIGEAVACYFFAARG